MAAPSPTHSTIAGVPASNFHGRLLNDVFSSSTDWIISPPLRNGGIVLAAAPRGPTARPAPLGPGSLWPGEGEEVAAERLHVDRRGAAPTARRRRRRRRRARAPSRQISRTGLSVPSEFDWCTTATSLTRPTLLDLGELVEVEAAVVGHADVAQRRARRGSPAAATAPCSSGAPSRCTTITSPGPQCALP